MKSAEDHGGVVLGSTRSRIDQLVLGESRAVQTATPSNAYELIVDWLLAWFVTL